MCRNLQQATPSLADLVQQVLGRQLRQEGVPHDCERDALAAMELVLHGLRHGCRQDLTPPATQVIRKALHRSCLLPFSPYCMHCMTCASVEREHLAHLECDPALLCMLSWALGSRHDLPTLAGQSGDAALHLS